jgi:hypothetical protein
MAPGERSEEVHLWYTAVFEAVQEIPHGTKSDTPRKGLFPNSSRQGHELRAHRETPREA